MTIPKLHVVGAGLPFVWMHAMLNSVESDSIYSLIDFEQLSQKLSVIRFDACNKSAQGDFSWEASTIELRRIAEKNNLGQMILGGCSMGSGTAIHAAVKYPELVKGLVLVTPPPAWEMRKTIHTVYKRVAQKSLNHPQLIRKLITQYPDPPNFYEEQYPGTRQQLLDLKLSFEPAYYTNIYLGGSVSDLPSREQISSISVPTLIVEQLNDENHPVSIARELNGLIKHSELFSVSDFNSYLKLREKIMDFINSNFIHKE